jgi:hypothetical protein
MLAADSMLERLSWAKMAGITFNGKRDLWEAFGYDDTVTIQQYRMKYRRGGIAKRIVDALPNATWRGGIELIETENPKQVTAFEQAWIDLDRKYHLAATLNAVDILSRQSTFAALLLGAPGDLEQEMPRGKELLYVKPYLGNSDGSVQTSNNFAVAVQQMRYLSDVISIEEFETDAKNPRYGEPKFYRIRDLTQGAKAQNDLPKVHWSRVIHIADGCLENWVYGAPALEAVWNLIADLEKVTGGGAESFFQRANQGRVWNIDPEIQGLSDPEKQSMAEQIEKLQHGMLRDVRMRGVKVQSLGSDVAQFGPNADAILTQIAGTTTIPKRILTGSEMGELASSQDRDNWVDQVNGRREQYADPMIVRRIADRLITYGYLPEPKEYESRWGKIMNLTEAEKQAGALSWAQTVVQGKPVFTEDEIRDHWYGMDPLPPEVKNAIDEAKQQEQQAKQPQAAPGDQAAATEGDVVPRAAQELVDELEEALMREDVEGIQRVLAQC